MKKSLLHKNSSKKRIPDNFLGLDIEYPSYEDAKVTVIPVAYEGTVTYGKGAAKGPKAIIDASKHVETYERELGKNIFDIYTLEGVTKKGAPEDVVNEVYNAVKKEINNKKQVVVLGGEHSITIGAVKAFKEKFYDLSVLQIDAHSDLRQEYEESRYSHACVMRRIFDMNVPFVQVGIRSFCDEEADFIKKNKLKPFYAEDIYDNDEWMDDAISRLSDNVYLTFDLDGLDPSIMPATGTPEPGGLGWYQAIKFLKKTAKAKNIVGFDIVELAPIKKLSFPDFIAAKLTYKMIGYCFFDAT